jgi:glycosyltransferase involved in cell wall biosynthesis
MFDLMYERFADYAPAVRSRPYRLYRWAVRHVVQRAICISDTTAEDLETFWQVERSRTTVVPLGTDVERWSSLAGEANGRVDQLRGAGPAIVSVYNLEPRKNLGGLLKAMALLRPQLPDLRLILFGQSGVTPEREGLFRDTVRSLGLDGILVQCGVLDDPELARLYAAGTVFVYPSRYEGFGLPLLEAMACGACVASAAASAMAEVVGNAGLLTDVDNAAVLAQALGALLRDPARQATLRGAARRRADEFTVGRMAEATYQVYRSLAEPQARRVHA